MQRIEIGYRKFWIERKVVRDIPTTWSELGVDQLIIAAEYYLGLLEEYEFIATFCGISKRLAKKLTPFCLYKLAKELEFLNSYTPLNFFIIDDIKSLSAPNAKLGGVSFGQFMFADTFYNDWCRSGSDADLNKFVTCIYFPKNYEFDNKYVFAFEKRTARLDKNLKYAISLNYRLVKEWLTDRYPLVFERPEGDEKPNKKRTNNSGWVKVFENIVGDDIIHSDNYAKLPVHNVLRFLSRKIKENSRK